MNPGKQFENDFKASVPDDQFFLRLNDAGGWSKASDLRFTPSSLCDCILFSKGDLYLLELKSHKGYSIPQSKIKQLGKLAEIDKPFVYPCLVLNYRDHDVTYLLSAKDAVKCLTGRKSIPMSFCKEHGRIIGQVRKRTRYRYLLETL